VCSGVAVAETRRRRFVSINRVLSQHNDALIDAICEEGRAWWLVIGSDNAPYNWSELRPLPEIEVEVTEQPAAEPSPTAEFISDLVERMGDGSLTLAEALKEFGDRSPVSDEQIPPGPYSEDDLRRQWNAQADDCNRWESLDSSEQLAWAQARAIAAVWRPTPEAATVATDQELLVAWNRVGQDGFDPAIRAVYDLGRQHGAAQSTPPASPPASAGGLLERVHNAILAVEDYDDEDDPGFKYTSAAISVGQGLVDLQARAAIREVAAWIRVNYTRFNAAWLLEWEASR